MGNNIIDVNMDYNNIDKTISNFLGTVVYATSVFKDCGFTEEQIWSALELLFGVDIRPDEKAFKSIKYLLDGFDNYDDFMRFFTMLTKREKL